MILLDTNVLVYASDPRSGFHRWACQTITEAVNGDGAAVDAITLAELCVGAAQPEAIPDQIREWGIVVLDVPAAASEVCARAYRKHRTRRKSESGKDSSAIPLPDFFIGAHAQIMGWTLATADAERFKTHFPRVALVMP